MPFKHAGAVYDDDNGEERLIYAKLLKNEDELKIAKRKARGDKLFDLLREAKLHVNMGNKKISPHFVADKKTSLRFVDVGERNVVHTQHIDMLINKLVRLPVWKWIDGKGQKHEFRDYSWSKEAYRTWRAKSVVHDLVGHARNLHISSNSLLVAIEVINDHFPEEEAMIVYLAMTKVLPLVIFFDCVKRGHLFMKLDEQEKVIQAKYYVYEGAIWKRYSIESDWRSSLDLEVAIQKDRRIDSVTAKP